MLGLCLSGELSLRLYHLKYLCHRTAVGIDWSKSQSLLETMSIWCQASQMRQEEFFETERLVIFPEVSDT